MSGSPKKPTIDHLGFNDAVEAGLSTDRVPPAHPCPSCKVETKDTGLTGWRLCTDCDQRVHTGLTEAQHILLLEELAGAKARVQQFELLYKTVDAELAAALRTMRERGIL